MLQYFELDEFKCPCCEQYGIRYSVTMKLDDARRDAGVPFKINSGFRCPHHNKVVGGSSGSSHLDGWAVDIAATHSTPRFKIVSSLIKVGFRRIGIAKTFIHTDDDPNKSEPVIWVY
jgi:zinc D-Ala-D-Ala carboxypeptidase